MVKHYSGHIPTLWYKYAHFWCEHHTNLTSNLRLVMNCLQPFLLATFTLLQLVHCECNFEDLVASLLQSEGNKYELAKTFFPPEGNPPEYVQVLYTFSETGDTQEWHWSTFTSSFIHPPEVHQFTSLFFAKPHRFYDGNVKLKLSNINKTVFECTSNLEMIQFLTQRVSYI